MGMVNEIRPPEESDERFEFADQKGLQTAPSRLQSLGASACVLLSAVGAVTMITQVAAITASPVVSHVKK